MHVKDLEKYAIHLGLVHKRADIYVSDDTLTPHKEQKMRNRRILDDLLAVNELGECYNPGRIRRTQSC